MVNVLDLTWDELASAAEQKQLTDEQVCLVTVALGRYYLREIRPRVLVPAACNNFIAQALARAERLCLELGIPIGPRHPDWRLTDLSPGACSTSQAARCLGVSPRQVRRMVRQGCLRATRRGQRIYEIDQRSLSALALRRTYP